VSHLTCIVNERHCVQRRIVDKAAVPSIDARTMVRAAMERRRWRAVSTMFVLNVRSFGARSDARRPRMRANAVQPA